MRVRSEKRQYGCGEGKGRFLYDLVKALRGPEASRTGSDDEDIYLAGMCLSDAEVTEWRNSQLLGRDDL
jgi:hypothetical protein